jgi:hypothetical protein
MDDFISWLKDEDLFSLAEKYAPCFKTIFKDCLNAGKEKILLIGDYGYPTRRISPLLTASYYLAAKDLGLSVSCVMQEPKRGLEKADPLVIQSLFKLPLKSAIIVNSSGKIGMMNHVGKSFRKFCKTHNHKFISTTSLGAMDTFMIKSIMNALDVDYKKIQSEDLNIKAQLIAGKTMTVKTRLGTNLAIDLKGSSIRVADGNYSSFGFGGNLPAGEVYFAPPNIDGTVAVDASSKNDEGTIIIQKPIIIQIEKNRVIKIEGGEEAELLKKSIEDSEKAAKYPERISYLAEFGIGTNLKAKIVGSTIIDEKAYGTAHVAIGSNYWFGGTNKTIAHYDQVFKHPPHKDRWLPFKIQPIDI